MEIRRSTLNSLKVDTQRLDITLELNAWKRIVPRCKGVQITAGGKIQNQARVAESWIFPSESVAASEQTDHEGASTIARFFEPGDFCANPSASIRCSLNRQFSNECCVPHLGHPNHSPLKHPSKSMERQERRTKIPFRFFVTEPRSVGPRYGDLCFEQQCFIPATSAKEMSCAPSATQSPCRVGGPTMRGGPKGLDSAPLMITGSKVCQMSGTRTKRSFRHSVEEPRSVGPRYGDLCFEQQRFIPATSAKDLR